MRRNQSVEYLYNVARDMMGRTKAMQLVADGLPVEGAAFRRVFMGDVQSILRSWNAETLGSIVSFGRGDGQLIKNPHRATLREVGLGESTTEHMDGRMLLLVLASLTIVAAMLDLARCHQREREGFPYPSTPWEQETDPAAQFEKMPDRLMHF